MTETQATRFRGFCETDNYLNSNYPGPRPLRALWADLIGAAIRESIAVWMRWHAD
jgi:hypothetical protein